MSKFLQIRTSGKPLEEDPTRLNAQMMPNTFIKPSTNILPDNSIKSEIPTQLQRLRPGMKKEDIPIAPMIPLDSASPFSLEMYLSGLIANEKSHPISMESAKEMAEPPYGIDPWIWAYELIRRLTIDLNILVVGMLEDSCSPKKCPEMRANEWQYLCACHNPPQECSAIDYILHTLDNTTTLLCSNKYFPSKISIPISSTRHFSSIMRRLYRIFSHAWYKHYETFWKVENEISLYRRFMAVSEHYHFKYENSAIVDEAYYKETKDNYRKDTNKEDAVCCNDNYPSINYGNYETLNYSHNHDDKENLGDKDIITSL
ncbi:hypothetical protein PCANB_003025 [Pneumocystis canis]|nr:hypothetical protein PCK1_003135 [Pneumocystis canis]KAG5438174.1 hypothetical protein PCANB_003025 [Pneumocystis canis]